MFVCSNRTPARNLCNDINSTESDLGRYCGNHLSFVSIAWNSPEGSTAPPTKAPFQSAATGASSSPSQTKASLQSPKLV